MSSLTLTAANGIAKEYGTRFDHSPEDAAVVSAHALPRERARVLVSALERAGFEASDAPDNNDHANSWIYVTVEV